MYVLPQSRVIKRSWKTMSWKTMSWKTNFCNNSEVAVLEIVLRKKFLRKFSMFQTSVSRMYNWSR